MARGEPARQRRVDTRRGSTPDGRHHRRQPQRRRHLRRSAGADPLRQHPVKRALRASDQESRRLHHEARRDLGLQIDPGHERAGHAASGEARAQHRHVSGFACPDRGLWSHARRQERGSSCVRGGQGSLQDPGEPAERRNVGRWRLGTGVGQRGRGQGAQPGATVRSEGRRQGARQGGGRCPQRGEKWSGACRGRFGRRRTVCRRQEPRHPSGFRQLKPRTTGRSCPTRPHRHHGRAAGSGEAGARSL